MSVASGYADLLYKELAAVGDTWYTNLQVFLDENGAIAVSSGPARKLAEHITAIVAMASIPELIPSPEYQVRCRRRPGRKPCQGIIEADFDPEDYRIIWWCPVCDDRGYISNWQGSMWDLSEAGKFH